MSRPRMTRKRRERKREMLDEMLMEDYDYFDNSFDAHECSLDGAMRVNYDYVEKKYDEWKASKKR